jgi:hypothetical protein
MSVLLLLTHGLLAVALMGALTHQVVALVRARQPGQVASRTFLGRYSRAGRVDFAAAVALLFLLCFILGAVIYPAYRIDVRIPFEEMGLIPFVGLFEVKEHWGGLGVGMLPLYVHLWKAEQLAEYHRARISVTVALSIIVWSDFLIGHILNNTRGL